MRLPGRRAVSPPAWCYGAFLQGESGLAVLQVRSCPAHSVPAVPGAWASRLQAVRCFCQCWTWHARVQYHSFLQREHRLAASTPHSRQRGLSGARASSMSRLYICAHLRAWSFSSSSVGLKACFTWCLAMASHLPMFFLRIWSQMTGTWWERQSGRWQPEQAGTGGQLAWGTGSRGNAGCACGYTGNRATCPTRQQALGEIGKTQLPGRAHHPHAVPTRAVAAARTQCSAAIRLSRFFHPSLPQIRTAREGLVAVKGKAPAKSSAWRGGCCFKQH